MLKSILLSGVLAFAVLTTSFAQTQKKTQTSKSTTVHSTTKTKQNAPQPKQKVKHTMAEPQVHQKKAAVIPEPKDPSKRHRSTPVPAPTEKPLPHVDVE